MNVTLASESSWVIEQSAFEEMCGQIAQIDLSAIAMPGQQQASQFQRVGSTAVIEIAGVLEKHRSLFSFLFGGTSLIDIQNQINAAAADPKIEHIVLHIDSPGGTVSGTSDAGEAVARARQRKPVTAFISDMGTSGAYWIASQANQINANATARIGSVGVLQYLVDMSALFDKRGLRAIAIGSGKFKAIAAPGTEITQEQQDEIRRLVEGFAEQFISAVRRGRGSRVKDFDELATARVYRAPEAQQLGLIDRIDTFDVFISELQQLAAQQRRRIEQARATIAEYEKAVATAAETFEFSRGVAVERVKMTNLALHKAHESAQQTLQELGIDPTSKG